MCGWLRVKGDFRYAVLLNELVGRTRNWNHESHDQYQLYNEEISQRNLLYVTKPELE